MAPAQPRGDVPMTGYIVNPNEASQRQPRRKPAATKAPADTQTRGGDQEASALFEIEHLLRNKDDTNRFLGLSVLKAVLDTRQGSDATEAAEQPQPLTNTEILHLWEVLPIRFLDRLLRSGRPGTQNGKSEADKDKAALQRDVAVGVLHTFAVRLLPEDRRGDTRMVNRIPLLVPLAGSDIGMPVATSSDDTMQGTTTMILQTLVTLVSRPEGAHVFNQLDSSTLGPLTDLAPTHPLVFDILLRSWLYGLWDRTDKDAFSAAVHAMDGILPSLVDRFKGTDGVTFLDFLAKLLRNVGALENRQKAILTPFSPPSFPPVSLLPKPDLAWLRPTVEFIRNLIMNRPNVAARTAYTNAAAALVRNYPVEVSARLWETGTNRTGDDKPFVYLFVSLVLVDIRTTVPRLLSMLNTPQYAPTATRLASAYDVLSAFIGYLVTLGDEDNTEPMPLSPDNMLRLRTTISETLSLTAEHLRDRWDAAVAGALGLHPDARGGDVGGPGTVPSSAPLLAWDAAEADTVVTRDRLVLAALQTLALWLREDDNDVALKREVAGLSDMLVDLYVTSGASETTNPSQTDPANKPYDSDKTGVSDLSMDDDDDDDESTTTASASGKGEEMSEARRFEEQIREARTRKVQTRQAQAREAWAKMRELDFRPAVLVALEGLTSNSEDGGDGDGDDDQDKTIVDQVMSHGTWSILTADMLSILRATSSSQIPVPASDTSRGIEIVRVLLPIVERARPGTEEARMDVATHVAAWAGPEEKNDQELNAAQQGDLASEFQVAVLELVTALATSAHPAMLRRYRHTLDAVIGLASRMQLQLAASSSLAANQFSAAARLDLKEQLDGILSALETLRA